MPKLGFAAVAAEVEIPQALADAIARARQVIEAERGGRVVVAVDSQAFTTWWTVRAFHQPRQEIEQTPVLTLHTEERSISQPLVVRGTDTGSVWLDVEHVARMVRWVLEGGEEWPL